MTWKELGLGIERAVSLINKQLKYSCRPLGHPIVNGTPASAAVKKPVVVAILSNVGEGVQFYTTIHPVAQLDEDTATYSAFLLALERLTHPICHNQDNPEQAPALLPFPLSIRNSPAATAHLLRATNAQYVFVDDGLMRNKLHEALSQRAGDAISIEVLTMPTFSVLFPVSSDISSITLGGFPSVPLDTPAMILHSSGKLLTLLHLLYCIGRSNDYSRIYLFPKTHYDYARYAFGMDKFVAYVFHLLLGPFFLRYVCAVTCGLSSFLPHYAFFCEAISLPFIVDNQKACSQRFNFAPLHQKMAECTLTVKSLLSMAFPYSVRTFVNRVLLPETNETLPRCHGHTRTDVVGGFRHFFVLSKLSSCHPSLF